MLSQTTPAWYLVFDLLAQDGEDLVELPLSERRAQLETFARAFDGTTLRLSPATRDRSTVDDWFARVGGALDGVIAKRADAAYASGSRDAAVKVKRSRTADCVVAASGTRRAPRRRSARCCSASTTTPGCSTTSASAARSPPRKKALIERLRPHAGEPGFTGGAPDTAPSRWDRDPAATRAT